MGGDPTHRRKPTWGAAAQRAAKALEANRARIEQNHGVTPSGRDHSRRTTTSRGYASIKARFNGSCLDCGKKISAGTQVRYWFNHGITCRSCGMVSHQE